MNKGILVILDGYGEGKKSEFNAVENANTPTLKRLKQQSMSLIKTSGRAVGLFDGDMGGSEVGHTTIGAGRVVPSIPCKITDEIESGEFKNNKNLNKILIKLQSNGGDLHLIGLCSDKNIHSNINHALEIVSIAESKVKNIYFHIITDGRDTPPYDSVKYVKLIQNHLKKFENCHVLSVVGRFYAMDREERLERTEQAFNAMFSTQSEINEEEIISYIEQQHNNQVNDQFIKPIHVNQASFSGVKKNDCILFFNFREDRVRQMAKKCEELKCDIITMADVGGVNSISLYSSTIVKHTLSEYLSSKGLKHIKIGETTKYAHITYFLNGGREEPFENENRVHVPTLEVDDFSKTPQMRADEIADEVQKAINKNYDAIIVNFSNPDMVGHTGDYEATVKALECLDKCVNKILAKAKEKGYFVILTADHGNSEEMRLLNGQPHMAHTLNDVFFVVADSGLKLKAHGELKDVAPTFVELLGLEPNKHFEGESLILR